MVEQAIEFFTGSGECHSTNKLFIDIERYQGILYQESLGGIGLAMIMRKSEVTGLVLRELFH